MVRVRHPIFNRSKYAVVHHEARLPFDTVKDLNRYMTKHQIGFEEASEATEIPESRIRKFWLLKALPNAAEIERIERWIN